MEGSIAVISVVVVFSVGIYHYFVRRVDRCSCTKRLDGKTVIVTGANTGIGKATAEDLAKRGARVILACRDKERGLQAEKEIRLASENEEVRFMQLNLASFSSVRTFVGQFTNNDDRLDILINNAGVISDGTARTEDGHELSFGVNHLGHFLLTHLLMDKLKQSSPSRIINVSSDLYLMGDMDFNNLDRYEGRMKSYPRSKLANILFTRELARNLQSSGVSAFTLHPGSVDTDIKRNWSRLLQKISPLIALFLKNSHDGAQTTIHCAVAEDIEKYSGGYFKGCRVCNVKGQAADDELAKKLWDVSLKMTGFVSSESIQPNDDL